MFVFLFCFWVPNAPCGVESVVPVAHIILLSEVPNAPCGVESRWACIFITLNVNPVPNAPCGVERDVCEVWDVWRG